MSIAWVVATVSVCFSGCATPEAATHQELFLQRAPMPQLVARERVFAAAQQQAAASAGDFALLGVGQSMEPFYRAGTAVVVHPTSFHMLRPGMAVVYVSRRGRYVAHMLTHRSERGWVVKGLNNPAPDTALVTEKNLVGIIKHAFAADDIAFESDPNTHVASYRARDQAFFLEPSR